MTFVVADFIVGIFDWHKTFEFEIQRFKVEKSRFNVRNPRFKVQNSNSKSRFKAQIATINVQGSSFKTSNTLAAFFLCACTYSMNWQAASSWLAAAS